MQIVRLGAEREFEAGRTIWVHGRPSRWMSDNPMVTLNRAIAVAMVQGPAAGLALVDTIAADGRLANSHRLDAVRGHLLELAGDRDAAVAAYLAAANRTTNRAERHYLLTQAAALRER